MAICQRFSKNSAFTSPNVGEELKDNRKCGCTTSISFTLPFYRERKTTTLFEKHWSRNVFGSWKMHQKAYFRKKRNWKSRLFERSLLKKKKTCELVEKVLIIINQENGYFRHFSNEFGHEMNSANWQHCLKARNSDLTDISSHHYFEGTAKVCMTIIAVSIVFSVKNAITKSFPKVDSSSTCQ